MEGGRQVRGDAGWNRAGAKGASPAGRALGDGETRVSPEVAPKTVELAEELNSHFLQLPVLISADLHALENSTALRGAEEVNRCRVSYGTLEFLSSLCMNFANPGKSFQGLQKCSSTVAMINWKFGGLLFFFFL